MTMTVSDKAAEKLKDELTQSVIKTGLGYRIIGKTRKSGCIVFSILLDKERPDDEEVASHGIRIFLTPADAALLRDHELDYLGEQNRVFCLKPTG